MIKTEELTYPDGATVCRGFIAYPQEMYSPKPAVMVAHDWGGRGEDACNKAKQLAALGYVGFALDMYGEARLGFDKIEKRALMSPLMEDRNTLRQRIQAAFNFLHQLPQVSTGQIAALGYCFGGLCVLDLARSGVDVQGVVSFHGLLSAAPDEHYSPIKAKVLVLHGYEDPLVKPEQVTLFAQEMGIRQADWQVHMYGRVFHSFTNPLAHDEEMGLFYDAQADRRSWQTTQLFLNELFHSHPQ